jgi:RHS repeat-associated protein
MGVVHEFHPFGELRSTTIFDRFRTEFHLRGSNRLTIQDPTGARHTVRSLVPGLIERTYACGSLELAQFDPRGRCAMKAVWQGRDDPKPWIRSFQFSGESDLIRVEDSSRGGQRFRYDQAHRLVGAESANGSQETYEYDAGDNLLRGPGLEGVSLLSGNRIQTANGEAFQYDDRQNVASRASSHRRITFAYDSRNFLTACNGPGLEWRAEYDPLGRRTRVAVNGRSRRFFWDGDRLAAELAADGGLRIYVYPDLMAFVPCLFIDYDSVEDDPRAGRRHAIFTDHLGAPVRVHDASGQPVWQARYTPYGLARVEASGSIDFALRRPGQYFDKDTGLHYNRYRYYDPVLGRFLQPDPLDISGGLNLYGYSTSPLSVLDLLGLNACPVCAKGGHDNGHDPESDPGSARLPKPSEIEPVERPPGSRPFDDLPSLEGKSAQQVREILEGAGFTQTQHERTLPSADGTGRSVVTDSRGGSEIWMRRDQNGNYEAVRIDQHGHDRPPPMRPGGPREGESFAGEPPHVHREYIPNDQARRDGAAYPPNHPQAGQSVLPPGSTAGDAADSYNQGFTPGVYDSYNDGGAQVPNNDFGQTHTPLGS